MPKLYSGSGLFFQALLKNLLQENTYEQRPTEKYKKVQLTNLDSRPVESSHFALGGYERLPKHGRWCRGRGSNAWWRWWHSGTVVHWRCPWTIVHLWTVVTVTRRWCLRRVAFHHLWVLLGPWRILSWTRMWRRCTRMSLGHWSTLRWSSFAT